jgi:hypothetical protein
MRVQIADALDGHDVLELYTEPRRFARRCKRVASKRGAGSTFFRVLMSLPECKRKKFKWNSNVTP